MRTANHIEWRINIDNIDSDAALQSTFTARAAKSLPGGDEIQDVITAESVAIATSPYEMRLDLRVLDHLGIRLYSNAAAVLSEAVANAWDADARRVKVSMGKESIVIEDDGRGMTLSDVNERFLNVGYDKRLLEGAQSPNKRQYMGRKGIGKLALFSIADVVEVHTVRGEETNAFRMATADIKATVKTEGRYHPEAILCEHDRQGTLIKLSSLKKRRTSQSIQALRKRVARRFSIIGLKKADGDSFDVDVDGIPIGPDDRDDLKAVEFLWEFGDSQQIPPTSLPNCKKRFLLPGVVAENAPNWIVRGWMGAASQPKKLKTDESGTMNGLVVLARGRLIQENILDRLQFSRILSSYLTGQIEADFLDVENEDDIATSDRQRLIEDDERYVALTAFLRRSILSISDDWTALRNEARGTEAVEQFPVLAEWFVTLPEGQRASAKAMLGLIQGVELDEEAERTTLYRCGILAFERLRMREASHQLADMQTLTAAKLLPLLSDLETLEASMYRDIVAERVEVIRSFTKLVDDDARERVLQAKLFENLWLIDPGWERAAGSERIETILKRDYPAFSPNLTEEESKGRMDIRYKTNAGQHIIVELKRAGRKLTAAELLTQGQKYMSGLTKCLNQIGIANPDISVVFVLGKRVIDDEDVTLGPAFTRGVIAPIKGRVVYYEEMIHQAMQSYSEYLSSSDKADAIDRLVKRLV